MERYALFATTRNTKRTPRITFRVGMPTTLRNASARWQRMSDAMFYGHREYAVHVAGKRRPHLVAFFEVRAVDEHGRGLGRPDHFAAIPVLAKAARPVPDAPHTIETYRNRSWTATRCWGATLASDAGVTIGYGHSPIAATADARVKARQEALI